LAVYILKRIVENGGSIQKLIQDLDNDEKYPLAIVSFLEDIGWMKQEPNGEYVITNRGILRDKKMLLKMSTGL
jgi:hypothetical protein